MLIIIQENINYFVFIITNVIKSTYKIIYNFGIIILCQSEK